MSIDLRAAESMDTGTGSSSHNPITVSITTRSVMNSGSSSADGSAQETKTDQEPIKYGSLHLAALGNTRFVTPQQGDSVRFVSDQLIASFSTQEKLVIYYERFFPWENLCKWLVQSVTSNVNDSAAASGVVKALLKNLKRKLDETPETPETKVVATESAEGVKSEYAPYKRMRSFQLQSLNPMTVSPSVAKVYNGLERREICLQYQGGQFLRFMTASFPEELKALVLLDRFPDNPLKRVPDRIEIGAVYTHSPSDRNSLRPTVPDRKEITLDIDITDYAEVRPCCGADTRTCKYCWPLIRFAMKVLTAYLRKSLGISNVQWVYSGNKGVHAWIPGAAMSALGDEEREKLARAISVLSYGTGRMRAFHPMVQEEGDLFIDFFRERLTKYDLLANKTVAENVLKLVPSEEVRGKIRPLLTLHSVENWNTIVTSVKHAAQAAYIRKDKPVATQFEESILEMMLFCTAPRIDVEVMKRTHLIKAPWCIHPSTKRVCVPIALDQFDEFDPDKVPTLDEVVSELRGVTMFQFT